MTIIKDLNISSTLSTDSNIAALQIKVDEAVKESKEIDVFLKEDVDKAATYSKHLAKLGKLVEDTRKNITSPIDTLKKDVMEHFKNMLKPIEEEVKRLDNSVMQYLATQRQIALEAERKARREAEEKAMKEAIEKEAKLKAEAEAKGENPANVKVEVPIIAEVIPQETKLSNFTSSGVTTMKVAKWKVTNINAIPKEYFILNEQLINGIRKAAGVNGYNPNQIPGIEFYCEETIVKR